MADANGPGRVPPSDLDAEAAVLSAVLLEPGTLDLVRPLLTPAAFYADANRRIYETAVQLSDAGKPVDVVSVAGVLRDREQLQQIGGTPYLALLSDATPAVAHVEEHARRVVTKGLQRALIAACTRFAAEGFGDVGDVPTWAQGVAQALSDVACGGDESDPAEFLSDVMPATLKALGERVRSGSTLAGVDTGLRELNKRTGGLVRGKVHTIGARPGMGKSTLLLQIAHNVAASGLGAAFLSLEMSKEELALKLLAADTRVDHERLRTNQIDRSEWPALAQGSARLARLPLVLKYCPGATIPLLRSTIRQERRRLRARGVDLGLVVVDYLQIMSGQRARGQSREEEVAALMRGLLQMAAEANVALLVASQLNRGLESRSNKSKRPGLADLRESGSIEQDSYSCTLLYRDEKYDPETRRRGVLEANVAKARGGREGVALLRFSGEFSRVDDLAEDYDFGDDELDGL